MVDKWSQELGFGPDGDFVLPDRDGVYVIARVTDGASSVHYVGKGNIRERVQAHMDFDNEENDCLANVMRDQEDLKVRFTLIDDEDERSNTEYSCYEYYLDKGHPLCNEVIPAGQFIGGIPVPF